MRTTKAVPTTEPIHEDAQWLDAIGAVMARHGMTRVEWLGVVVERPLPPPPEEKGKIKSKDEAFEAFADLNLDQREMLMEKIRREGVG